MRIYFLALGTLLIVCVGCAHDGQQLVNHHGEYHAPPAEMLAHPGPMVGGPGPGVMLASANGGMVQPGMMPPGMMPPGMGCPPGPGMGMMPPMQAPAQSTQVRFLGPEGMQIGWQIGEGFADAQITAPGRYNFHQGATYRLKLARVPGREGLTLYPSLHIYPVQAQTAAYLEHNTLPIRITDEDLDQVETNNFVTKVIYLPDAKYQELAIAGVEELVSTRLGPGLDPVAEADRRGTIMAVVRIGNLDYEMPTQLGGGLSQQVGPDGELMQASHVVQVSGEQGQYVPPMPIGMSHGGSNIPGDMMMSGPSYPGQPPYNPVMNVAGGPTYGYPITGTPIGLPGPPHLPLGRPAGLKKHTVRNTTDYNVGKPVDQVLIDVRHEPGISMPEPVKYIQYTESHPSYGQGEVSMPAWAAGQPAQ
ncbi:MAG: hypothetical protein KDA90_14460 [Planctomycetaceae bacterium]|nr:hypothetical protein [Planctomycetaceae bacterium]